MSRTNDPNRSELIASIRKLVEDNLAPTPKKPHAKAGSLSLVRARVTRHVIDRAQSRSLDLINTYELTSIRALLAWAANEHKAPQETIEAVTEVRFGVDDVTQLPRRDYDDVIRFLIDLRIDEMKN